MPQPSSVPVSLAALVPLSAALISWGGLWCGPVRSSAVTPLLPLPLELFVAWLPFLSLCFWFARAGAASRKRGERAFSYVVGVTAALAALSFFFKVRLPAWQGAWSAPRLVTELSALASTTWRGLPLLAAAALLGWGAATAIFARAVGELLERSLPAPLARKLRALLGVALFAFGSSAVLRYATGSPWPLIR